MLLFSGSSLVWCGVGDLLGSGVKGTRSKVNTSVYPPRSLYTLQTGRNVSFCELIRSNLKPTWNVFARAN